MLWRVLTGGVLAKLQGAHRERVMSPLSRSPALEACGCVHALEIGIGAHVLAPMYVRVHVDPMCVRVNPMCACGSNVCVHVHVPWDGQL